MKNSELEIQIGSEEVQEILSYVPNWLVRYGNTIVLLLLLITWFVKYPDVITAEVVVTTKIPPEKIYAKSSGKIETILVNNKAKVTANSIIEVIKYCKL